MPLIESDQTVSPIFTLSLSGSTGEIFYLIQCLAAHILICAAAIPDKVLALEAENAKLLAELELTKQQQRTEHTKEKPTPEQAYQKRIQDLEEKLAATYQQPQHRCAPDDQLRSENEKMTQEIVAYQQRLAKAAEENRLLVQNLREVQASWLADSAPPPTATDRVQSTAVVAEIEHKLREKDTALARLTEQLAQTTEELQDMKGLLERTKEEKDRLAAQLSTAEMSTAKAKKRAQEQTRALEVLARFREERRSAPTSVGGGIGTFSLTPIPKTRSTQGIGMNSVRGTIQLGLA